MTVVLVIYGTGAIAYKLWDRTEPPWGSGWQGFLGATGFQGALAWPFIALAAGIALLTRKDTHG